MLPERVRLLSPVLVSPLVAPAASVMPPAKLVETVEISPTDRTVLTGPLESPSTMEPAVPPMLRTVGVEVLNAAVPPVIDRAVVASAPSLFTFSTPLLTETEPVRVGFGALRVMLPAPVRVMPGAVRAALKTRLPEPDKLTPVAADIELLKVARPLPVELMSLLTVTEDPPIVKGLLVFVKDNEAAVMVVGTLMFRLIPVSAKVSGAAEL